MSVKRLRAFVDRIEGDLAVLYVGDDESCEVLLPAGHLPDGAGEGSVLTIDIELEAELTAEASRKVEESIRRLTER